jgi:hypothetical protein
MVTDQDLHHAIAHDPFHQAMLEPCPVADMLAQLFPNTDTHVAPIWTSTPRTKAKGTFRPGRSQPRQG